MALGKEVAAQLFKAEHFQSLEFRDGSNRDLIEWAEWEVSKVTRTIQTLSCALGKGREDTQASVRDVDLDGMLSLMAGRLSAVSSALDMALKMSIEQRA